MLFSPFHACVVARVNAMVQICYVILHLPLHCRDRTKRLHEQLELAKQAAELVKEQSRMLNRVELHKTLQAVSFTQYSKACLLSACLFWFDCASLFGKMISFRRCASEAQLVPT